MKVTHDFHIHTDLSICANETATLDNYIGIAKKLGLKKIGISNHFWNSRIPGAFDGDHYSLAFDKPGTWSIKYNLVWDRYFDFELFDKKVAETEIEFYKTKFNKYGLPLDSRENYTKSDWQMWVACLTEDRKVLDMVTASMWQFINDTEDRIPFTDFYQTITPDAEGWFRNRSVQGGLFMPILFVEAINNDREKEA